MILDEIYKLSAVSICIPFTIFKVVINNFKVLTEQNVEFAHKHQSYEIYYVTEGSVTMHLDDVTFNIEKGTLCWINPGVMRNAVIHYDGHAQYAIITFDFISTGQTDNAGDIIEESELRNLIYLVNQRKYWIVPDKQNLHELLESLNKELAQPTLGGYIKIRNMLSNFIVSCAQNIYQSDSNAVKSKESFPHPLPLLQFNFKNYNLAMLLVSYMHRNYKEDISLKSASEKLNITTRHINRILNVYWGATFGKILSMIRVGHAKALLEENPEMSFEKVAENVGYSSARILNHHFYSLEKITLSQFRQKILSAKSSS